MLIDLASPSIDYVQGQQALDSWRQVLAEEQQAVFTFYKMAALVCLCLTCSPNA